MIYSVGLYASREGQQKRRQLNYLDDAGNKSCGATNQKKISLEANFFFSTVAINDLRMLANG